jgi:hypothetical protein
MKDVSYSIERQTERKEKKRTHNERERKYKNTKEK